MNAALPELQDSMIDMGTFHQYINDLSLAEILDVRLKGNEAIRAQDSNTDLVRGAVLFEGKDVSGMQIKYVYEGLEWWDTLMWVEAGIRLIRIAHDWASYELEGE